ncbi:hypothetical protein F511_43362 [Dorcoceras hygrometricum]|uniref:Uncharacterized protein n=1 Tax=Dorcoceras hygrometricum TaxID=472368 RepID=A0A2Z7CGH7_9LAMI|nr:hypothetical protein F511_43362 [Dorcoceras hygrometricum]
MRAAGLASSLRLLLVDVACSVRLSEEATRVSQHFGVLTIEFSSCDCVKRSADVICVVLVAADQQARLCKSVKKRRRLIKWKRCVLSFSFERSAVGSNACVTKVASFWISRCVVVLSDFARPADELFCTGLTMPAAAACGGANMWRAIARVQRGETMRAGRAWWPAKGRWPRAHVCTVAELRRVAVRLDWRGDARHRVRPAAA